MNELREEVRRRYAESALSVISGDARSCCPDKDTGASFGSGLYQAEQRGDLPETAVLASLGCGNPTVVAELRDGETVLDLGSGGGIDVILSARRVGESGRAYGLDMTDEMLELAQRNAEEAGVHNAVFLKGHMEEIPLPAELRRRRDLQLRHQPFRGQAGRSVRDQSRLEAGWPRRSLGRRRRGPPLTRRPRRARQLLRLHRRCSLEGRV